MLFPCFYLFKWINNSNYLSEIMPKVCQEKRNRNKQLIYREIKRKDSYKKEGKTLPFWKGYTILKTYLEKLYRSYTVEE